MGKTEEHESAAEDEKEGSGGPVKPGSLGFQFATDAAVIILKGKIGRRGEGTAVSKVVKLLKAFKFVVTVRTSSYVAFYAVAFIIGQFAVNQSHQTFAVLLTNHGTGTLSTILVS